MLSLLTSYLSNRKQYVSNNDASSKLNNIEYGVPQGSVLGSILFILYINDIVNISNEYKYILFADDTTLVFSNENSIQLELSMNKVLLQLRNWLVINKLTINLLKTSYIIFNKLQLNLIITLDNMIIARSRSIRFLGLIIDDKLSWKQQFNNVKSKLYYGIATLRKLSNVLPTYILKLIYYSIFHSHLTYCTHILVNNYNSKMNAGITHYVLRKIK